MLTKALRTLPAVLLGVLALGTAMTFANADGMKTPMTKTDVMPGEAVATFAGGCFWCTESGFEKVPGVRDAVSGYAGGHVANPTYEEVSSGGTGHAESVQVHYDPKVITYEGLLQAYWRMIDPTDGGGQFVDRGSQYRPVIFYTTPKEKAEAEKSRDALAASGRFKKPIKVAIEPFTNFYRAEDYHQDYYKKNPIRYEFYSNGSGRWYYVEQKWGKDLKVDWAKYRPASAMYVRPSDAEIKKKLTKMQYEVTQQDGTEPPFHNAYWDNHAPGIYVDIVTGEPLFSSTDKFNSGTGWPSFTKPITADAVVKKTDTSFFMKRTEVRSRIGNSHLGHVFDDGPAPTGLRYCIDSAALRFIPADKLVAEGYGKFADLFPAKVSRN